MNTALIIIIVINYYLFKTMCPTTTWRHSLLRAASNSGMQPYFFRICASNPIRLLRNRDQGNRG